MEELEWLENEVLSEEYKKVHFKIAIIHMSIMQNEKNLYGMAFLAKHFGPVLKDGGIDLMISGHTHRNAWIKSNESGFDYPIMISSNNNFIDAVVNRGEISLKLKDLNGEGENKLTVEGK